MSAVRGGGTLVLDSDGLFKAATHRAVFVHIEQALRRRARVVVSAATLSEVLRGHPRDAAVHRILAKLTVIPVDEATGQAAGRLLGRANLGRGHAIDAIVAATALAVERPVLLLTSDEADLKILLDGAANVAIGRV